MIKLLKFVFVLSVFFANAFAATNEQIIEDAITEMNVVIAVCVDEVQNELTQAGADASQYLRGVEYSGETDYLVYNIDNRYKKFVTFADESVSNLFSNKLAILQSAATQISANIKDTTQAKQFISDVYSIFTITRIATSKEVTAYEESIQAVMHKAAQKSLSVIELYFKNGSTLGGVPQAILPIQSGVAKSDQIFKDRINTITWETEMEQQAFLDLVEELC